MNYDNWLNLLDLHSSFYRNQTKNDYIRHIQYYACDRITIISCDNTNNIRNIYFTALQQLWKDNNFIVTMMLAKLPTEKNTKVEINLFENFKIFKKFSWSWKKVGYLKKREIIKMRMLSKDSEYIATIIRLN